MFNFVFTLALASHTLPIGAGKSHESCRKSPNHCSKWCKGVHQDSIRKPGPPADPAFFFLPADPAFFLPADPAKLIQLLLEPDSMERLVVDLVQHAPDHVLPGVPVLAAL